MINFHMCSGLRWPNGYDGGKGQAGRLFRKAILSLSVVLVNYTGVLNLNLCSISYVPM